MFENIKTQPPHGAQTKPTRTSQAPAPKESVSRGTNEGIEAAIEDSLKVTQFIALYIKVITGAKWNQEQINLGKDITPHLARYKALEASMDVAWSALNDQERAKALRALVHQGYIPADALAILELAKATVTTVTFDKETHKVKSYPPANMTFAQLKNKKL